jgi:hypothetical protein
MYPIYYAAVVSSLFSVFAYLIIIWTMGLIKKFDIVILILFIISLFECYMAFYYVRMPLDNLIKGVVPVVSTYYLFIALSYAPITEEMAKIIPVWISQLFKKTITKDNQILYAMTIGLAFGIGEMFFLASMVSQNLTLMYDKWYYFYWYMLERFLVCFVHQILVIVSICWVMKKKIRYFFYAMLLHAICNLPIVLVHVFSITYTPLISNAYLISFILINAAILIYIYRKNKNAERLFH